jgi:hypothetical protein
MKSSLRFRFPLRKAEDACHSPKRGGSRIAFPQFFGRFQRIFQAASVTIVGSLPDEASDIFNLVSRA